jgi:hypothetical protein
MLTFCHRHIGKNQGSANHTAMSMGTITTMTAIRLVLVLVPLDMVADYHGVEPIDKRIVAKSVSSSNSVSGLGKGVVVRWRKMGLFR